MTTLFSIPMAALALVSSLSELRTAPGANDGESCPFNVTGQVVAVYPNGQDFVLVDDSGAYSFMNTLAIRNWTLGDCVTVSGHVSYSANHSPPLAFPQKVAVTGSAPVPPPLAIAPETVAGGAYDYRLVTVTGVLATVVCDDVDERFNWFLLRTPSAVVKAAAEKCVFAAEELNGLVDAEVALVGIVTPSSGVRQMNGSHVQVTSRENMRVLHAPAADLFAAPAFDFKRWTSERHPLAGLHRQGVCGRVLAAWGKNRFALMSNFGETVFVEVDDDQTLPDENAAVQVVGFPDTDPYFLRFWQARWRTTAEPVPASPETVAVSDVDALFGTRGFQARQAADLNGRLARIVGRVRDIAQSSETASLLYLKEGNALIAVDVGNRRREELPEVGDRVEVTGLYLLQCSELHRGTDFLRPVSASLIARRASDIRVIARRPWWTPARLAVLVGSLLTALVAIVVWNRVLRHLVQRRTRQLLKEQVRHAAAEVRVDERTRLAVELHDTLSQNLAGVACQLAAARGRLSPSSASTELLATAERMLVSSRQELKRCLWDLRTDVLSEPDFAKAIETSLRPVLGKTTLKLRFPVSRARLSDSLAHAVVSIVRELVANAVCHGRAATVRVAGALDADVTSARLRFSVGDDGVGFDPATAPDLASGHFGLTGIRERVMQFGGAFAIESRPGSGARAVVTLPVPEESA